MRVAVCGLGRMGTAMAERLVGAGHQVTTWNRTPGRVVPGTSASTTVAEATSGADVVLLSLLDGPASRVVLGRLEAKPGTLVVNVATIGPAESAGLAATATAAGLRYVEAPVLGSVPAVKRGTLRVLTAGEPAHAGDATGLLAAFSDDVRHVGPIGTACGLKLVANATLGIAAAAAGEAARAGRALGLDPTLVLDVLEAGQLGRLVGGKRDRLEQGEYGGADFTVSALRKDLALIRSAVEGLPLVTVAEEAASSCPDDADVAAIMSGA